MGEATECVATIMLCLLVLLAYAKPSRLVPHLNPALRFTRSLAQCPAKLANIFGILGTLAVVYSSLTLPPFQAPDEPDHWKRSAHIAAGHLFAHKDGDSLGADLPKWVDELDAVFKPVARHPDKRVTSAMYESAWDIPYSTDTKFVCFTNTAIYPPAFYFPQAMAITLGQLMGLKPLAIFLMARIFNALTAVAISCTALRLAGQAALAIFVMLCFPMTVHQMGSTSADATMIPMALLLAALTFMPGRRRDVTRKHYVALSVALALLSQTRFPLLCFFPLLWLPAWKRIKTPISTCTMLSATIGVLLFFFSWLTYVAAQRVSLREGMTDMLRPHLEALIHDPFSFAHILWHTIKAYSRSYLHCMVGVLGWLDTPIPQRAASLGQCAFIAAFAYGAVQQTSFRWQDRLIALMTVLAGFVGMQFVFYLTWSPLGSELIQGFQGRYLLTLAGPLIVTCSASRPLPRLQTCFFWTALISSFGCLAHLPATLIFRFFLQ